MSRLIVLLWLVGFAFTSCRNITKSCSDSVDHIRIIGVFVKANSLCVKSDSIYVDERFSHYNKGKKVFVATYDTATCLYLGNITARIVPRGFLDYPRKYPCVHSFSTNELGGDTIVVTIHDYKDLLSPWYPGKAEAEQYTRKFVMKSNTDCSYEIIEELDVWNG